MKKLFSVLLVLALALPVTACKKKEPAPAPDSSPLPTPPPQEAPADQQAEDKSNIDPFEVEAVELTKALVKSIDDIEKGKIEFDYEDFMLHLALVEDDDFTYYSYAPQLADGSREFIPARCEIIAKQIFDKDIPAKELMDDDFYNKEKQSYIVPDGIGLDADYMAENCSYASNGSEATVTFDLMEETDDSGDPVFKNIGKATFKYKLSTEKGGAYWTFNGYSLA
ncbi:MAG: hypothetical protein IJN27_01190 [Oscillospiraceae bacterium]|nr:hypothetical protein [Oscillospiraceae bacterium]